MRMFLDSISFPRQSIIALNFCRYVNQLLVPVLCTLDLRLTCVACTNSGSMPSCYHREELLVPLLRFTASHERPAQPEVKADAALQRQIHPRLVSTLALAQQRVCLGVHALEKEDPMKVWGSQLDSS